MTWLKSLEIATNALECTACNLEIVVLMTSAAHDAPAVVGMQMAMIKAWQNSLGR